MIQLKVTRCCDRKAVIDGQLIDSQKPVIDVQKPVIDVQNWMQSS